MGSSFKTVADLPNSESAHAYALLGQSSGSTETGRIVWHTTGQAVDAAEVRREVGGMLTKVAALPGVTAVQSPYTPGGGGQLNAGQNTAYALVTVTDAKVGQVEQAAQSIEGGQLQVELGGQAFAPQTKAGGIAEIVGILAALAILLLMFRSVWAAALPIVTGVAGVVVSLLFVMVGSHVVNLSSDAITMGALIGLGVGIDYALFIVNRYRKALVGGTSVTEAIVQAVTTSGRAVIFAGLTVIAALLAMFVVGMGVLTGMGQAAAVTVLFTVLAAITLLPSSAGAKATVDLVGHLRQDVIPAAESGSDLRVYVGGKTATDIDVAHALMSKLPLYLGLVAVLGFLLLALAFRSLLLPLIGAVSNPTTIVVGLGAITAIFQWGWTSNLLGVGDGAPISYIVPVMIVGVMFGLSMDYQVFLVSRMHEEWTKTRDNTRAIRVGLGETAKVIGTAAVIMLCVFSSFGFSGQRIRRLHRRRASARGHRGRLRGPHGAHSGAHAADRRAGVGIPPMGRSHHPHLSVEGAGPQEADGDSARVLAKAS
jgi:uncharacterized membrane protein YdfJ with MMPL/SSD domain